MDGVLGWPAVMVESQAEEEGGEDSQETAVSSNTSLTTESDSDDDSEVSAANIEVLRPVCSWQMCSFIYRTCCTMWRFYW